MIESIIRFSIHHKLIVLMFVAVWVAWGVYSLTKIPIGAVPDITNNQVQILTTSRNLSTLDIEQFITYPVELEFANLARGTRDPFNFQVWSFGGHGGI